MRFLSLVSVFAILSFGTDFVARAQATDNPFAGTPTRYSVDVVTTQKGGKTFTMRMYVDGDRRRTEQDTANGRLVLILRGDLNLMYTIIVSRKAYRVRPLDPSLLKSLDAYELAKGMLISPDKVGTETVKGQVCDKYRFSSAPAKTQGSQEAESNSTGFIWISQLTHLPVLSQTADATTEWENLDLGPQDSSLFTAPPDFQLVD
jgi:hypothetical protein